MKKTVIAVVLMIVTFCCILRINNSDVMYEEGDLYYSVQGLTGVCTLSHGQWRDLSVLMEMVIADEVDGHRVTVWGNDYPDPFLLNLSGVAMVYDASCLPEKARIVPLYLRIHVGKNLKTIREIEMKDYYQDADDPSLFYQILVMIECDPGNRFFYSDNGKLYRKINGQLIDDFYYAADYDEKTWLVYCFRLC